MMQPPDGQHTRLNPQTRNVLQLGVGFFFIFLAFNSQGFIEESVLDSFAASDVVQQHDGYTSLAIIYASFTVLNFAAAPIVGRIGPRWAMVFGGLSYALFQAGFLFLNRWYLFGSSALLGLGAAVIWTAQGKYLAMNSQEETAGKHSGLFWALSQACQACGGLFLLLVFLFQHDPQHTSFSQSTVQLLYATFTAVTLLGVLILAFLRLSSTQNRRPSSSPTLSDQLDPINQTQQNEVEQQQQQQQQAIASHFDILKSTFRLAATRRMAIFAPVFMYTGCVLSFWSGIYPTAIVNTEMFHMNYGVDPKILLALNAILQGIGQTSSGFLFGILDTKTRAIGRNRIVLLGSLVHLVAFAGIYANIPSDAPFGKTLEEGRIFSPRIWLALVCGFLLGFGDACWNTQIFAVLIGKYPQRSAQAFSLFKFFQSLMTCAAFFYSGHLYLQWHILILLLGCLVATVAFFWVEKMPREEGDDTSSQTVDHSD